MAILRIGVIDKSSRLYLQRKRTQSLLHVNRNAYYHIDQFS